MAFDFFVSYSEYDRDWAEWITWELKQLKYTATCSAFDCQPGSDFMVYMRTALAGAKHLLAVLSPAYFKSEYAQMELGQVLAADPLGKERKLLPVRVCEVIPPDFMRTRIYVDLVNRDRESARREFRDKVEAFMLCAGKTIGPNRFTTRPKFPGPEMTDSPSGRRAHSAAQPAIKTRPGAEPLRILFLATAGTGLDATHQFARLKAAVSDPSARRRLLWKKDLSVTTDKLLDRLNQHAPHIFHISGKQEGGNVILNTSDGDLIAVSDEALAGLLVSSGIGIRLAILDTCYSLRCAKEVARTVDCAIGVESWIYDEDATDFYVAFYRALACGRSLADAHGQAKFVLSSRKVPRVRIPTLCHRQGVDPSEIVLLPSEPRQPD